MLATGLIDAARTWGAPADGGCWTELQRMDIPRPADELRLLRSFGNEVADVAGGRAGAVGRWDGEVASALAAGSDAKLCAMISDADRGSTHSIAAALVHRLAGAYTALDRIAVRRATAVRGGEIDMATSREAFLWRMYACSHLDLATEIHRAPDARAMSDASLEARVRSAWPSRYELAYPWGTRCFWAGYVPRMGHIIQAMPWLGKSQLNKRHPLCHVVQKAFPGKGLYRKWDKIAAEYCCGAGRSAEVGIVTAAVLRCALFGGYVGAGGGFPVPRVALGIWRDMGEDPQGFVTRVATTYPKVSLCAWQEFLSWSLGVFEPLQSSVASGCDLEVFSGEVSDRADNCVRARLCTAAAAVGPDDALAAAEAACVRSYAQAQCGIRRPTNRPEFSSLFVRAVNTRVRDKETAAGRGGDSKELEMRAARPLGGSTVAAVGRAAGVVAPWKWSVTGMHDAMRLAGVPQHVARTVSWLSDTYEARSVTDDSVKTSLNKTLDSVPGVTLRGVRACMASVAFTGAISVMPLSAATVARHLEIVPPERRFAFVCPSHLIVAATFVATNRGVRAPSVHRGLKFVSYGMGSDSLLCNKQIKAPRTTARAGGKYALAPPPPESAVRSKTSCGVRMITVPTVGVAIRIKSAVYAICEECGELAKLNPDGWCTAGRIVCPTHSGVGPGSGGDDDGEDAEKDVTTADDDPETQCAVCRARGRPADTQSRVRVRAYSADEACLRISVVTCCLRCVRATYGESYTTLPRLLSLQRLHRDYLQRACEQDAMRNPYNRRPTNLQTFLRASSMHDIAATEDWSPAEKRRKSGGVSAPVLFACRGKLRRRRDAMWKPPERSHSPSLPIRPVTPPTASPFAWDGIACPTLDAIVRNITSAGLPRAPDVLPPACTHAHGPRTTER
jgi:hypothetical protein